MTSDYDDRDDRPSWKDIDSKKDRSKHVSEDKSGSAPKAPKKEWAQKMYMKEIENLFKGKKGSKDHNLAIKEIHQKIEVEVYGMTNTCTERYDSVHNAIILTLPQCGTGSSIVIRFPGGLEPADNPVQARIFDLLNTFETSYEQKEKVYACICQAADPGAAVCGLQAMDLPSHMLGAITEILCGFGMKLLWSMMRLVCHSYCKVLCLMLPNAKTWKQPSNAVTRN